jgi:hypothetical protein
MDHASIESLNINVYCRLFSDIIPQKICVLRKSELDTFAWNTCGGCSIGLLQYRVKRCADAMSDLLDGRAASGLQQGT